MISQPWGYTSGGSIHSSPLLIIHQFSMNNPWFLAKSSISCSMMSFLKSPSSIHVMFRGIWTRPSQSWSWRCFGSSYPTGAWRCRRPAVSCDGRGPVSSRRSGRRQRRWMRSGSSRTVGNVGKQGGGTGRCLDVHVHTIYIYITHMYIYIIINMCI